jgi:hypothetical protein
MVYPERNDFMLSSRGYSTVCRPNHAKCLHCLHCLHWLKSGPGLLRDSGWHRYPDWGIPNFAILSARIESIMEEKALLQQGRRFSDEWTAFHS